MASNDFEVFRAKHDPNTRRGWSVPFRLNAGESIASAVVEVVDSASENLDLTTDLVIEASASGQISGTLWGVTAWISGGTAAASYYLRYRIETDATPLSNKADKTMRLDCKQL